jgi:enoyl-CoA hydratase/carnithine racemase
LHEGDNGHSLNEADLTEGLLDSERDDRITAVVITGAGRGFCAGQDLSETAGISTDEHDAGSNWVDTFERLYSSVRGLTRPALGAINGVAAGSGFQFSLLLDLRIGHPEVRMGQPEILSGIPSITGLWAMWSVLGRSRTTEFALTGELVHGDEAHRLGLLNRLTAPELVLPQTLEIAARLGSLPQRAMRETKRRLVAIEEDSFQEAFAAARRVHDEAYRTGEPQRGMQRFAGSSEGERS